jgi:lysozyme
MTILGVDLSHHQEGIDFDRIRAEGFQFVFARVGQGTGRRTNGETYALTRDREWPRHRDETRRVGLELSAYWYVGSLMTPAQNAATCRNWLGDVTIPVALDVEDGSGSITFLRAVYDAFGEAGLRVPLIYVPRWYWSGVGGSASLAGLPPLWSSRYVAGTGWATVLYPGDQSSHWTGYGGNHVAITQFTSQATVAGRLVDANAFRGTREQLHQLLYAQEDDVTPDQDRLLRLIYAQLAGVGPDGVLPDPDKYPGWETYTFGQNDVERRTLVDFVRETHRQTQAAISTDHRPGGQTDNLLGHLLSLRAELATLRADVTELKSRPVGDVDEAALATELQERGVGGVTAAQLLDILNSVRFGQEQH